MPETNKNIVSPEKVFEAYWDWLKETMDKRNTLPPRTAMLIFEDDTELVSIDMLGGFLKLGEYILKKEKERSLKAFIVSFGVDRRPRVGGTLLSILFPGNIEKPIAKMADWTIVNNKIFCEETYSGSFEDHQFGYIDPIFVAPKTGMT